MQHSRRNEFTNRKSAAAGCVEMIHVGAAIGINARQQWNNFRERVEIVPVDDDACGARNGDQMNRVIGRATGRQKPDNTVDDCAFIDDFAEWRVVRAECRNLGSALRGRARERIAQGRIWRDERSPRQMQAHHFHQQLIAVGGAVKRTSSGAVIGAAFGFEQRRAIEFSFCKLLANLGLLVVG